MINYQGFIFSKESITPIYRAKIELDLDPLAERFAILNRQTLETIYTSNSDITLLYVNQSFISNNNLILIILDDNRDYNAAVIDGINGQIVDVTTL